MKYSNPHLASVAFILRRANEQARDAGKVENVPKRVSGDRRASSRTDARVTVNRYNACSHALKAYRYSPEQGNVFNWIMRTCEKVRDSYADDARSEIPKFPPPVPVWSEE